MDKLLGIDVSVWQGNINWHAVKADGVDFAILRTGYGRGGENQIDKTFYQNLQGAKTVGLKVGVYHYSYAESVEDAKTEAQFCLSIIGGTQLDLPIYFDIEDSSIANNHDKNTRTQMCIAFCSEIEKAGYWAGVYANKNWFSNLLNYEELKARYTLWLAHYGIDSPSLDCDIWQYCSDGQVHGISGNVDMNYMYRDLPGEISGATPQPESEPIPEPTPQVTSTSYTVKAGDTLSGIAEQFNTTYQAIAELNGIDNPNLIYAGQILSIPQGVGETTYIVQSGDTLSYIANKFGTTVNSLVNKNNIENPDLIYVGQKIKI